MSESISAEKPSALLLAAGADREGESRGLGISTIAFKVSPPNPSDPFILENTFLAKGGPARHLHYEQEEWFYILEGEFQFEVGAERFHLHPGRRRIVVRQRNRSGFKRGDRGIRRITNVCCYQQYE